MKKALLILLVLLVTGCDSASEWLDRKANQQTILGYSQCVKENDDVGLSSHTLRRLCIKKHDQRVVGDVDGRAGYSCSYGACSFSGTFQNRSDGFVITQLKVSIYHEDNTNKQGNINAEIVTSPQLWIEPEQYDTVNFQELTFEPDPDRLKNGDEFLYTWTITEVQGLVIKLN